MKKSRQAIIFFVAGSLMGIILWDFVMLYAKDTNATTRLPNGIYMELTKEFYEAMLDQGPGGAKTYSNDPSNRYLKEIAISSRFMVETNLQILKQQETLIQMLRSFLEEKKQ